MSSNRHTIGLTSAQTPDGPVKIGLLATLVVKSKTKGNIDKGYIPQHQAPQVCYHAQFGRSTSQGVSIKRRYPKIGAR